MPGASGAFLAPGFFAAAAHFTFGLGIGPGFALIIHLSDKNLMHHFRFYFYAKNLFIQIHLA